MFNGRHCTYKDYQYLIDIKERTINYIKTNDLDGVRKCLELINDFDVQIASRMLENLKEFESNLKQLELSIIDNFNELENNVLVDIKEHR